MPDPITNELLFDIMKAVQADVEVMRREVGELKAGMATLSARVTAALALVHTAFYVSPVRELACWLKD